MTDDNKVVGDRGVGTEIETGNGTEAGAVIGVPGLEAATATAAATAEALTSSALLRLNRKRATSTRARWPTSPASAASWLSKDSGERLKAWFTSRSCGKKEG